MFVSLNPTLPIPWWPICLVPRRSPSPHSCSSCCCSDGLHRVPCRWSRPVLSLSCPGFSDASGRGAPRNLLGTHACADQKCEHWRNTVDARGRESINKTEQHGPAGGRTLPPWFLGPHWHSSRLPRVISQILCTHVFVSGLLSGPPQQRQQCNFHHLESESASCFRKTTCTHRSETSGNKKDTLKPSHALSRSGPLVVAGANWRACGPHTKAAPQGPRQALCDREWQSVPEESRPRA